MRFYLASSYARRAELQEYRSMLHDRSHIVTSRWLCADQADRSPAARERYADEDLADVAAADVLILWTNSRDTPSLRNGRMVECGYAMGLGKPVWIVGARENLFLEHSRVLQFGSFEEVLRHLDRIKRGDIVLEIERLG